MRITFLLFTKSMSLIFLFLCLSMMNMTIPFNLQPCQSILSIISSSVQRKSKPHHHLSLKKILQYYKIPYHNKTLLVPAHKPTTVSIEPIVPTTRSIRSQKPSSYLQDHVCSSTQTTWCYLGILPPDHMTCVSAIEEFSELYRQTIQLKQLTFLPTKRAISCKWVSKTKLKVDGSLERLKARLVI